MSDYRINRQLAEFGEHVRGWRMVLGLTTQQVFEQTGTIHDILRKIESGNPNVSFNSVTQVLRALDILGQLVGAANPPGQRHRSPPCRPSRQKIRPMTTTEILSDANGSHRLVGQACTTRSRGQTSATFLYDPTYPAGYERRSRMRTEYPLGR